MSVLNKTKGKIRLADIAEEAGVSVVTVAKVLHKTGGSNARVGQDTAARIRQIADRLNYQPNMNARLLTGKRSKIIGVVMDSHAPQINYEILAEIEDVAARHGYKLLVGQIHNDVERLRAYAGQFAAYGVDGVICLSHTYQEARSMEIPRVFTDLMPTVFLEKPIVEGAYSYVDIAVEGAFRRAVDYLYESGRRKIALLIFHGANAEGSFASRWQGYREGLAANSLAYDERLVRKVFVEQMLDDATLAGIIAEWMRYEKPEAILAGNDQLGAMAIRHLSRLGISVPQQVAVVGYDNIDVSRVTNPALTTFDGQRREVARTLFEILLRKIENKSDAEENIVVEPIMMKRESA